MSQLNEPIIIVDGVRVDRGGGFGGYIDTGGGAGSRLDDINPESIERIEILKGASAATLFGTEASNGNSNLQRKGKLEHRNSILKQRKDGLIFQRENLLITRAGHQVPLQQRE